VEPEVTFAEDVTAGEEQSFEVALAAAEVIDAAPADAPKSMKRRAIQGSIWTFAGYGLSQVVRFGANIVLTRLLFPRAFGLMALISVLMQGLQMFSDLGIGPAIIKHTRNDDPDFFNTAWTMQVFRGVILWLCGCALAIPAAWFWEAPMLASMLPVAAMTALIAGFGSTKLFIEGRELRLERVVGIEVASQVISVSAMIVMARFWASPWSLVWGGLLGTLVKVVLSHVALPGMNNRFCWHRESAHHLYHFGRWIFISTLFTYLAMQIDRLLLGRLVSLNTLGIYSIALGLVSIVTGVFEQFSNRILMPAMAHVKRSSHHHFGEVVSKSRKYILSTAMIVVANMILLAPAFFYVLYDKRYHDAGMISRWLGFGLWFTLLQRTSQASLLALGHSKALAVANATNFIVTIICAPVGFALFGMQGFILGWTLGNLAAVIIVDVALAREDIPLLRQDAVLTIGLIVFVAIGLYTRKAMDIYYVFTAHALIIKVLISGALTIVAATIMYFEYLWSLGDDTDRSFDFEENSVPNALPEIVNGVHSNGAASEANGSAVAKVVHRD
jgi:O-antigen/teichoic acid export membrane protein